MVFEKIVATLLDRFLGKYVTNFDAKNLKIGLVSGEVILTNLEVIDSAFDQFNLPLSVLRGTIGLFKLKIPVTSLQKNPVIVEISDIFIVLRPKKFVEWDMSKENEKTQTSKQQKLEMHDLLQKEKNENKKQNINNEGLIKKLTNTIINNVQVTIKNVHIRYEDVSIPSNPVAFGFTMKQLIVGSCNKDFEKTFIVGDDNGIVYKIVELEKAAAYINSHEMYLFTKEKLSQIQFIREMKKKMHSDKLNYLIQPIKATLKLTLQQGKLNFDMPQAFIDVQIKNFDVHLDDQQYRNIMHTFEDLVNFQKVEEYRYLKPKQKISKENVQEHLDYIINVARKNVKKKYFSWNDIIQRKNQRKEYIQLYKMYKDLDWLPKLENQNLENFQKLEEELSSEDIILLRELALSEIDKEIEKNPEYVAYKEKMRKKKKSIFNWPKKNNQQDGEPQFLPISKSDTFESHKDVITKKSEEIISSQKVPEDYTRFKFCATLLRGCVMLEDNQTKMNILVANITNLDANVDIRGQGAKFTGNLQDFDVVDLYNHKSFFNNIASVPKEIKKHSTLGTIVIDYKPISKKSDLYLGVKINRTDLVLNFHFVRRLVSFFVVPTNIDLQEIKQISYLGQEANTRLKTALKEKMIIDLDFSILAPRVLVPFNCDYEETEILIFDLGNFSLKSDVDAEERAKRIEKKELTEKDFFDNYQISLKNVHVLRHNLSTWTKSSGFLNMENLLVNDVSFQLDFGSCITPENIALPQYKLNALVSPIELYLSQNKIDLMVKTFGNGLKFLENPRVDETATVLYKSFLTIYTPKDKVTAEYWVELRENIGLLLYHNPDEIHPIKKIKFINEQTTLISDLEEEKSFKIILPQADATMVEIICYAEALETKQTWVEIISSTVDRYSNSLLITGKLGVNEFLKNMNSEEKEETNSNNIIFKLNFWMEDFSVFAIPNDQKDLSNIIFKASLSNFKAEFLLRKYDLSFDSHLNSFSLMNHKEKQIVSSKMSKEKDSLVNFSFIFAHSSKSDKYDPENAIKILFELNDVNLKFDQESLSNMFLFAFNVLNSLKTLRNEKKNVYAVTLKSKRTPTNKFKFSAKMDTLTVNFEKNEKSIGIAMLKYGSFNFLYKFNYVELNGKLGDLVLEDCDEETTYPEIIGLRDKSASLIEFKYDRNLSSIFVSKLEEPTYIQNLTLRMSCLKVVFVQKFITRCVNYFATGKLFEAIKNIIESAMAKPKGDNTNVLSAPKKKFSLPHFDIQIENPIIILPVDTISNDKMIGNLGSISVKNSLKKSETGDSVDSIEIKMLKMNIKSIFSDNELSTVNNTDFSVFIDRIVELKSDVKQTSIKILLPIIDASVSNTEYDIALRFIEGNILANQKETKKLIKTLGSVIPKKKVNVETKQEDDKPKIASAISILLKIDSMKLILSKKSSTSENDLAQLLIENMNLNFDRKSDSSFKGDFTLHRVTIFDQRNDTKNYFKQILYPSKIKDYNLAVVEFERLSDGFFEVKLKTGGLKGVLVPDFVVEMKEFASPERLKKMVDDIKKINDLRKKKPTLTLKQPEKKPFRFKIEAKVENPQIVFPENCFDKNSRLLIAEAGMELYYIHGEKEMKGMMDVSQIKIYPGQIEKSDPNSSEPFVYTENNTNYVLYPLTFTFDLTGRKNVGHEFKIKIITPEEIKSRISYQDVKTIVQILMELKKLKDDPLDDSIPTTPENRLFSSSSSDSVSSMDSITPDTPIDTPIGGESPISSPRGANPNSNISQSKQISIVLDAGFESKSINLTIVNDIKGIDEPVFNFYLNDAKGLLHVTKSSIIEVQALATLNASVNYHNHQLAAWEPILEPWAMQTTFSQQNIGGPSTYHVNVGALETKKKNPLLFNVTQSMLETTLKTLTSWKAGISGERKISSKFVPYIIRNQTGLTFKFSPKKDDTKVIELKTGIEIGYDFEDVKLKNHELVFDLDKLGKHVVNVKKVQSLFFHDESEKTLAMVFLNVDSRDGKKIVTLRSGVRVSNTSTIPWTIGITSNGSNYTKIGNVDPCDYISIPIPHIFSGYLAIRPTDNDSFDWTPFGLSLQITELMKSKRKHQMFECRSTNPFEPALAYYFTLKTKCEKEITEKDLKEIEKQPHLFQKFDYNFEIQCPFSFRNLLECTIDYEVFDKSTLKSKPMVVASGKLSRGERVFLYKIDLENIILMRCKPEGKDWKYNEDGAALVYSNPLKVDTSACSNSYHAFESLRGKKRRLDILIDYISDSKHSYKEILLYVSHWIINKTNMMLNIKNKNIDFELYGNNEAMLVSFRPSARMIQLSALDSQFTNPFTIDKIGQAGNHCLENDTNRFDIAHDVVIAPTPFFRTKILIFSPKMILFNETNMKIGIVQYKSDIVDELKPGQSKNYFWPDKTIQKPMICLKVGDIVSSPFSVDYIGDTPIKISDKTQKQPLILDVQIQLKNGSLSIILYKPDKPPYLIINETDYDFQIHQVNVEDTTWKIEKSSKHDFSWDDNLTVHSIKLNILNQSILFQLDELLKETKYSIGLGKHIYASISAKGPTKVLRVTKKRIDKNEKGESDHDIPKFSLDVTIPSIGISIIDKLPQEILFVYFETLKVSIFQTSKKRYYDLKIDRLEVNNQMRDAIFPILFSSYKKRAGKEFIHLSACQTIAKTFANEIPYFSFAMQEAEVNIDYIFLKQIADYVKAIVLINKENKEKEVDENLKKLQEFSFDVKPKNAKKFYFDSFELHPLKFTITFRYNTKSQAESSETYINTFLNSIGTTVANIDEIELCLNSLILKHPFETQKSLIEKIKIHYQRAVSLEIYKFIGGMNAIGNPIGLFNDLGTGVTDFFYEPAQAIFMVESPLELIAGISRGSESLIKKSLHGTFGTASKISTTFRKGLDFLTFDEDYKQIKEENLLKKSYGVAEGFSDGSRELIGGISNGITGIVTNPINGIRRDGAFGLIKGIGKGLIGVPMKSASGILTFVSKTTEGISNIGKENVKRIRPPRLFNEEGLVLIYKENESKLFDLLYHLSDGAYKKEKMISYLIDMKSDSFIILTNNYLICIDNISLGIIWSVERKNILKKKFLENESIIEIEVPSQSYFFGNPIHKFTSKSKQKTISFFEKLQ
eukprot:gene10721-3341_t